jgi:hypothetical protein
MQVVTVSRVILLVGVLMILLAAFGVSPGAVNLFFLGVGIAFASWLVP